MPIDCLKNKSITIITGRGLYSASGESKLRKDLKKRIEREEKIRWETVPSRDVNTGGGRPDATETETGTAVASSPHSTSRN